MTGQPRRYLVRIEGHLDSSWAPWFGDLDLTREPDGTTILRCLVRDQSELHGLLARVRDLGVVLVSVTPDRSCDDRAV
jgi:hypothetical protein